MIRKEYGDGDGDGDGGHVACGTLVMAMADGRCKILRDSTVAYLCLPRQHDELMLPPRIHSPILVL